MLEPQSLRTDIIALLDRGVLPLSDEAFNSLALRVFDFQFHNNTPYRKYCQRRISGASAVTRWQEIPAVPTAAFKEAQLVAGDAARAQAIFRTSGTTRGAEKRGVHYVLDLELYERSLLPTFRKYVLAERTRLPMVSLVGSARQHPDSSLSYMVTIVMEQLGTTDSWFAVDDRGLRVDELASWLRHASAAEQPVCIMGTSLAFLHWFDQLRAGGSTFQLARDSVIMDTGGFKGSERSVTAEQLRVQYTELLGVPQSNAVNEYGMTEMLSQFYDDRGIKAGPPWVRSMVVDPETLEELPFGESGLLRHVDLANLYSVSAIQTEDLGRLSGNGLELLGRVAGAAPRGCSIAMDLFLSAAR
ncbi:MAG TPA: hypothetical protein VGC44_06865 [Longimicrobiales bacterium]